jgi:hypothetical protein
MRVTPAGGALEIDPSIADVPLTLALSNPRHNCVSLRWQLAGNAEVIACGLGQSEETA